jgi:hypothetical protein
MWFRAIWSPPVVAQLLYGAAGDKYKEDGDEQSITSGLG